MGFKYQYCETDPLRKPKPTPLLEANPRGLVPAIRQGGWACAESSVILEYVCSPSSSSGASFSCYLLWVVEFVAPVTNSIHQLEDTNSTVPLHPTIPKLKANCRLWINFVRFVRFYLSLISIFTLPAAAD